MSESKLRAYYKKHKQEHVFNFWEFLSSQERQQLLEQLATFDLPSLSRKFQETVNAQPEQESKGESVIKPFTNFSLLSEESDETRDAWLQAGVKLISEGAVAAVLLAGGQGTRLGSKGPKGCFDLKLLSGATLFQLFCHRIRRLQQEARAQTPTPLYIMTSSATHAGTVKYFKDHKFFGLQEQDVFFFQQGVLPCFENDGRLMMGDPDHVAVAPDGNGGVYPALQRNGVIDDMRKRGIRYVHIFGVDNILTRVCDPVLLGFAEDRKADCVNKCVRKLRWNERVGVMCLRDGRPGVIEYSDISQEMAKATNSHGLVYGGANIAQHLFSFDFLSQICGAQLPLHMACKKIGTVVPDPHPEQPLHTFFQRVVPTRPNGVKLEHFIFDVFGLAKNLHCLVVERCDEFSPVKNKSGDGVTDSPATARADLCILHMRWLARGLCCEGKESQGESNSQGKVITGESPSVRRMLNGLRSTLAKQYPAFDGLVEIPSLASLGPNFGSIQRTDVLWEKAKAPESN